jgi:hypothetical protein
MNGIIKNKGNEINIDEYKKFLLKIGYQKKKVQILKLKLIILMKRLQA